MLTRKLLAFSPPQPVQLEKVCLNDLVSDSQRMLRRIIPADISLTTHLCPGHACTRADRNQLEQVLMNLVVNARDAMPSGGVLTVETAVEGQGESAFVRLRVRDTGHGMDEKTRQRIFEPFFTTKPVGKGTGLGLATVYGIVQQLGGRIEVGSAPGQGATFDVWLPASEAGSTVLELGPVRSQPRSASELVLLVEDEEMVRAATRRILARNGYRVLEAADGVEALELFDQVGDAVCLVLSDLIMPRRGGRELKALLQSRRPGLPVLLMSAYDREASALEGRSFESIDVPKPSSPEVLLERVRTAIDLAALARAG